MFESASDRELAIPHLVVSASQIMCADGCLRTMSGWERLDAETRHFAYTQLADPELDHLVDIMVSFGANREKILSLAKSVDRGEIFNFEIPVEDKKQLQLL